ncbi:MAG: hypothetical protein MUF30_06245 [Burkholderiales bacterium]|jgi:hypothetical protein|nr:hypothetical protein [Burkholderiales bacterium]
MKVGLIQTRGLGDIVIAAPIAQHHLDAGHEVVWPVDARFVAAVQAAFPGVRFVPVDAAATGEASLDYFVKAPLAALERAGVDATFCLYAYLSGLDVVDRKLAAALKFDEYKYAVCGVPFARKWNLRIARDAARERALLERLDLVRETRPIALVHEQGSDFRVDIALPADVEASHRVVRIGALTDNPFDWLGVLERAAMFVCVDSVFANLAEQLDLGGRRFLYLRSPMAATPVFRNGWQFR